MIPNLKNIKKGTQQITKVMKGNMIVWENWKHKTGVLVDSNWSSPSFWGGTHTITFDKIVRNLTITFSSQGYQQDGSGEIYQDYTIYYEDGTKQSSRLFRISSRNWNKTFTIKTNDTTKIVTRIECKFGSKVKVQNSNIKVVEWEEKGN